MTVTRDSRSSYLSRMLLSNVQSAIKQILLKKCLFADFQAVVNSLLHQVLQGVAPAHHQAVQPVSLTDAVIRHLSLSKSPCTDKQNKLLKSCRNRSLQAVEKPGLLSLRGAKRRSNLHFLPL